MTEDEREHLLSTVGQAHAGLSEVALKLRLGLPPKTPVLKTAIKAERVAFDLKRSLQRLEVKDVETITRRAPVLPEVRRGGKVVDPESLLRHENRQRRRAPYRSSPAKYSSSIRLTACVMPVQTIPAGPREAARFIVCDKRSDINRVALTRAHMDQWKCDAEALARFVVEQVGLRRSRHRADASGTQPLGLAAGDIAQVYLGETRGFRPRSRR